MIMGLTTLRINLSFFHAEKFGNLGYIGISFRVAQSEVKYPAPTPTFQNFRPFQNFRFPTPTPQHKGNEI